MSTNSNSNLKVSGSNVHNSNKHQPQPQQQHQQQQKQPPPPPSSSAVNIQSQHTVPPRYQPPPQPPGGILKNIPSSKTVLAYYPQPTDIPSSGHLNIKYPPDVPKLAAVYIPEGLRSAIPSVNQPKVSLAQRQIQHRHSTGQILSQQLHQQQLQPQHHQPLHRIGTDERQQQVVANAQLLHHQQQQQHLHQQQQLQQQQHHQQQLLHHQQQQQQQDMLKFVRKPDATEPNVVGAVAVAPPNTNGRLSAEQNRHLQQSMITELRTLKEANQRLSDDNQELRDLCCFLDDDRQKGRKLAREWQRFGRYTASVMRQEVSAYQTKLRQLDDKQQELIRDNLELKELCLYLDEERANASAHVPICTNCGATVRSTLRDDGDGSSSSTNADEPMPSVRQFGQLPELNIRPTLSDQTLQYVRSLEGKIRQLEQPESHKGGAQTGADPTVGRPEAVVRALQILEVREQLERDRTTGVSSGGKGGSGSTVNAGSGVSLPTISTEHMDDGEKALVREMCNVVWRKLEESPSGPTIEPL